MRSSRLWPGSNSIRIEMVLSESTSTRQTSRASSWSATAATGRLSLSSTSMTTKAVFGSRAPRQRRGRNAQIGVSASSAALIGRIGPCAERLYGMDPRFPRRGKARMQIARAELVHQKTDGAAMHAVDRLAGAHMLMQRSQHQSVAAERHHDVGIGRIVIAVKLRKLRQRLLGLRARAGKEGNPVISLGRGHVGLALGLRAHVGAEKDRVRANVVYTTLAGLVEIGSPVGNVTRSRNARESKAGYHCAVANHANLARFRARTRIIQEILAVRINAAAAGRWREAVRRTDMAAAFAALRHARLALVLVAFALPAVARADDAPPPQPAATPSGQKAGAGGGRGDVANPPAAAAEQHRLPPDSTTKQTLALPGRTLDFTATAGSIRLFNDKGEPQADIAYTAYQLDGADQLSRPVTFVFNGGPGASSAWLQFGAVGPWRLAINADAVTSSTPPDLLPNAEL